MKKYFLELAIVISAFFGFFTSVNALTTEEQDAIDEFVSNYYDSNESYCVGSIYVNNSNVKYFYFYCTSTDSTIYLSNSATTIKNRNGVNVTRHSLKVTENGYDYSSSTHTSLSQSFYGAFVSNFDLYLLNGTLNFSKNYDFVGVDHYYTITFVLPSGATLVVKDSNNNVVSPESGSIYSLLEGTYSYSVTKNTYNSLTNVELVVDEDKTITIELESSLNSAPYRSIYSQYYTYISQLVSNIFGLENPLFLYIVAFIIGFAIITLIKRLIGGR